MAAPTALILARSKTLRLLTLFLFYLTQGAPIGVFFYAIPAWMAGNGASAADTAWVVGFAVLPWTLKLVNGFIIDRYTFLPMGRRRIWIVGAQLLVAVVLLSGAIIGPSPSDLVLLAGIAFCANMAVTFQDVAIDSLAIDIMPEEERAKAGSIMFGAQVLGIAGTTAMVGYLLQHASFQTAMIAAAMVPIAVAIYGIVISERAGERRLPWTQGSAHAHNIAIKIDAWWPLLKQSFKALVLPLSLMFLPVLFLRAMPYGGFEAFHPVLAQQTAGWSISDYTGLMSTAQFTSGVLALLIGAWAVERLGAQRALLIYVSLAVAFLLVMGLSPHLWTNDTFLSVMFFGGDILATFISIATIPICMRLCNPAVAATQFTIYMAVANFGRPFGAWVSGVTAGQGHPTWLYFASAAGYTVVIVILLLVRFPQENREEHIAAEELPHGDGIPARVN
jgi:PAT family beta-lactamase induction signal transducer AmpG